MGGLLTFADKWWQNEGPNAAFVHEAHYWQTGYGRGFRQIAAR